MKARQGEKLARMSSPDWHPEDIKAAVRKTGISLDALSREYGMHRSSLRLALVKPWPAAQSIIADRLGVAPQTIWPSRYDPSTGQPLSGFYSTGVLRSRPDAATQRPKSKVA